MDSIVEFIIGMVTLGFILFMLVLVPISILNDSKKPTKSRRKQASPHSILSNDYSDNDFDYFHSSNSGEFLVYFIENERLGSLKIGVGNSGRLKQLLESFEDKDSSSENIGWKVLKIAKFADESTDYEIGKENGNEAEKRAHYYWRYILKQPLYLNTHQLGFSRIIKDSQVRWVMTPGYTETVEMMKVCEVSSWNYIKNSPGYLGEINNFDGSARRELRLLHPSHSTLNTPLNYDTFNLSRVNHFNTKDFEVKSIPLINENKSHQEKRATNSSSTPSRKNLIKTPPPAVPYLGGKIGIYPCSTSGCPFPSTSMFQEGKCDKCVNK
jgi:hypothetical protein